MLSPIHLDNISNVYLNKIKDQLKAVPTFLAMTCDMLHKYNLTLNFDGSYTGEAVAQRISHMTNDYNLSVNNIIAVSKIGNNAAETCSMSLCILLSVRSPIKDRTCSRHDDC